MDGRNDKTRAKRINNTWYKMFKDVSWHIGRKHQKRIGIKDYIVIIVS